MVGSAGLEPATSACKADPVALEKVLSTYANQLLTHNKSSHGRFRGALKSLEQLTSLQILRHIYGTVIWGEPFC